MSGEYIPPTEKFPSPAELRRQKKAEKAEAKAANAKPKPIKPPKPNLRPLIQQFIEQYAGTDAERTIDLATRHSSSLRSVLQHGVHIERGYRYKETIRGFWLPNTAIYRVPDSYTKYTTGGGGNRPAQSTYRYHPGYKVVSDTIITLDGKVGAGRIFDPHDPVQVFETDRNCLVAVNFVFGDPKRHLAAQRLAYTLQSMIDNPPDAQPLPPESSSEL